MTTNVVSDYWLQMMPDHNRSKPLNPYWNREGPRVCLSITHSTLRLCDIFIRTNAFVRKSRLLKINFQLTLLPLISTIAEKSLLLLTLVCTRLLADDETKIDENETE